MNEVGKKRTNESKESKQEDKDGIDQESDKGWKEWDGQNWANGTSPLTL